ncbi:MAG: TonB family protein [Deltaproteobacteria bacterium]|jgi:TonB family protein|nr:TonB family protein [Deltaproteobacteria bacterium]MBT5486791.1 TonB family protein [Deltaproteobacteria bacterium]MBT5834203.1 TonB family protein [Deltaproteobacteria bacterium]
MFNLSKYFNDGAGLKYFCLVIIIISSTFFLSKISIADEDRALVAPMTVLGKVSVPEQQILFNRLREKLNQHFHIVSHKVLALIAEKGLKSIDIEDCTSSKCVKKVLSIIRNLELQFKTDKMFMFQLVRRENVTQMSLKYAEMSVPEITRKIVTRTCRECGTEKLIQNVDILVQRMFQKLMLKNIALPEKEISLSKKEVALPEKEITRPEGDVTSGEEASSPSPETATPSDLAEKQIPELPVPDPYIQARDTYNQHISKLLLDVTYVLQIFRSGMSVKLEISIDSSGIIVDQEIIKSSGSQDFDDTTMMTLEEIQFDPLPDAMLKFGNYAVILQIQNSR